MLTWVLINLLQKQKQRIREVFYKAKKRFKVKCLGKLNETLGMFETQKIPHKNETGFN